jgi:hypothetical protein
MTQRIAGPGIGLPPPQALYPSSISTINYDSAPTNYVTLNGGDAVVIPPGEWYIETDGYSVLQYNDPVTGIWRGFSSARKFPTRIWSDGQNFRVANLTGCPVAAVVTAQGSGYVQSSTTVTASTGNSTWYPIIGGAISTSVTVSSGGSGYTIAPTVYFPAPPVPGVPATGYATISGGAVTGVTVTNTGAGYTTAPVPVFVPSPLEPNAGGITAATATTTISGNAGKLCAVICTNPGDVVASVPTLTVSGAGSSATASAEVMCSITAATGSGGANYTSGETYATTVGGVTNATPVSAVKNPAIDLSAYVPRPAVGVATVSAGAITGFTFTDSGLFLSSDLSTNQPTLLVLAQTAGTNPSGALTVGVTLGSTQSLVMIQPV